MRSNQTRVSILGHTLELGEIHFTEGMNTHSQLYMLMYYTHMHAHNTHTHTQDATQAKPKALLIITGA